LRRENSLIATNNFNYLWDWTCRLVQAGICDRIVLEVAEGIEIADLRCLADADLQNHTGLLQVRGCVSGDAARVHVLLERDDAVVREATVSAAQFAAGVNWKDLAVELWWPNREGEPSLYTVTVTVLGPDRVAHDRQTRRVGFRNIAWRQCEGAPAGADPWLCVINGQPVFLQGVDWLPLAPNFADVPDATYRHRISLYRDLGVNTLRVWGGSYLEKEVFYNLCDEHGLLVWQDLMLSSSGLENLPPSDPVSISEMGAILRSFIARRQHHASLLLWCGGNELHEQVPEGYGRPMTAAHPLLGHLDAIVREYDPGRRFIPTTATGPRFFAHPQDLGKGLLGNVHGPWKLWGTMAEWKEYWQKDDALFRAETGAPGAAPADIIREYAGDAPPFPVTEDSPVWHRPFTWWIEADAFKAEHGREPRSMEEYVVWSQARQAEALASAMGASKARFPRIGGMLLWCGHDCCPIPANTSIIDYHGNPKPAARALARIWKNNPEQHEA
jgi:beta-mannosidase